MVISDSVLLPALSLFRACKVQVRCAFKEKKSSKCKVEESSAVFNRTQVHLNVLPLSTGLRPCLNTGLKAVKMTYM